MAVIQTWWSVVLLAVFIAMIAWVFWPRRKRKLEDHGPDSAQRRRAGEGALSRADQT